MAQGEIQRNGGPHRNPTNNSAWDLEVIHKETEVVGENCQSDLVLRPNRRRLAMGSSVEPDQANPRWRCENPEGLSEIRSETMLEEERQAGPNITVVKR